MAGVSDATREQVLDSAQRLGYIMSPMSIGRSAGQARCIAVLLPRVDTWFFGAALGTLIRRLSHYGYRTEVTIMADQSERNVFFASAPLRNRASGVIVLGMALTKYEIESLISLRVEVVGMHSTLGPLTSLGVDDMMMGRLAADHLIGLGHRRIAMICSSPGLSALHDVPRLRTSGFHAALREASIPTDPQLKVCGRDTVDGGARAMSLLLSRPNFPTAIFAHTDEMAFGALAVLRRAGLDVPRDVSVISIDDHALAPAFDLTTIGQQVQAQALGVADLLARRLANDSKGRQVAPPPQSPPVPHLILRSTTAPARSTELSNRVAAVTPESLLR